jgi:hypothetical protein
VFLVGIALICYLVFFALYNYLGLQSTSQTALEVLFSFALPPPLAFYWIDASVKTGRRSDPLLRDVLHWKKLRLVLWAWVVAADGSLTIEILFSLATGAGSSTPGPPPLPLFIFLLSPIFLVAVLGPVVLPRAAKLAGDKKFARHLLWFALSLLFVLLPLANIFIPMYSPSIPSLVPVIAFAFPESIGGYCLYRSVKSLIPLKEPTIVMGAR